MNRNYKEVLRKIKQQWGGVFSLDDIAKMQYMFEEHERLKMVKSKPHKEPTVTND